MPIAGVSLAELAAIAVPAAIVGGFLVTVTRLFLDHRTERQRRQPIVIAHEDQGRLYDQNASAWVAHAHLQNESDVPAFNVRFGVEYGGARFPYRLTPGDPEEGNYQRVVLPGARLPAEQDKAFPIAITSEDIWAAAATQGDLDAARVYWCRYENAQGETWETRNPGDRSARLDIRRLRWVKRAEKREQADRDRVRKEGWETQALEALRSTHGLPGSQS